jgi:hypothetical protein
MCQQYLKKREPLFWSETEIDRLRESMQSGIPALLAFARGTPAMVVPDMDSCKLDLHSCPTCGQTMLHLIHVQAEEAGADQHGDPTYKTKESSVASGWVNKGERMMLQKLAKGIAAPK